MQYPVFTAIKFYQPLASVLVSSYITFLCTVFTHRNLVFTSSFKSTVTQHLMTIKHVNLCQLIVEGFAGATFDDN